MPNRLSDPKWKSGPPEPKHRHSDHAIHPEDYVYDFDGPGRDEAEGVDDTIMTVVIEAAECSREGCDVAISKRHAYTLESLSERTQQALLYAVRQQLGDDVELADQVVIEYAAVNNIVVDYSGVPILGIQFDSDESYNRPEVHGYYEDDDVLGYIYPTRTFTSNNARGTCHGRPEPPSHEPYEL